MIIELVGLPGAGKTHLAAALTKRGATVVQPRGRLALILGTLAFEARHPLTAFRIFSEIVKKAPKGMLYTLYTNGYLVSAAKWSAAQKLNRLGKVAVIDQGHAQLMVMLQGVSPSLIAALPKPDLLVTVSAPRAVRQERMRDRGRTPRSEFGEAVAAVWDKRAEEALAAADLSSYPRHLSIDGTRPAEDVVPELFVDARQAPPRASVGKKALLFLSQLLTLPFPRTGAGVLMYHAVDYSGWRIAVTPEEFERQMRYLKEHQHVVALSEVVAFAKKEKTLSTRSVAVTFDDGYADLVPVVLPILERYQIPMTLFLTSNLSERTNTLGTPRIAPADLEILKGHPLITIEAHGRTHPHLPKLSTEQAREEIVGGKEDLVRAGITPRYFAYPFGDRSPSVEALTDEAGYEAAFAITEGFVSPGDNVLHLRRIQVDSTVTFSMFKARLTNALALNRLLVSLVRP